MILQSKFEEGQRGPVGLCDGGSPCREAKRGKGSCYSYVQDAAVRKKREKVLAKGKRGFLY
jgi:hypothetical protein